MTKRGRHTKQPLQVVIDHIFDKVLFQYQREWILDQSRFKICNKSRQIGMSTSIALEGLLDVLKGDNVYFISTSERQSIHLFDKFLHWADYLSEAGIVVPFTNRTKTDCKIGNVDIKSLTSKASTSQGFSGNIYLDEYALQEKDREIYNALLPTITHGYKVRIISRPFGMKNMFYNIFNDHKTYKNYSRHQFDVHRAIKDGNKINLNIFRDNMDIEGFKEQFECAFLDETTAYFTHALIRRCIDDFNRVEGDSWIGVDIGRTNDLTAIVTVTKSNQGIFYVTDVTTLKNKSFQEQRSVITEIIERTNPIKVVIDKGGLGMQLSEELEREFSVCKGIQFTPTYKLQLCTNMKKHMEDQTIFIPDDTELITDIYGIKKIVNSNNTVSFTADRNSRGHSDRFWALAMALNSATTQIREPKIRWIN